MYAGVYHIKTGALLQGDLVEYRAQKASSPQKGVFYCAGLFPRDQSGSKSHVSLKAMLCTADGAAFKHHPPVTKLTKLDDPPVQFTSSLRRSCVDSQKKTHYSSRCQLRENGRTGSTEASEDAGSGTSGKSVGLSGTVTTHTRHPHGKLQRSILSSSFWSFSPIFTPLILTQNSHS
jgi:hypothetical protein